MGGNKNMKEEYKLRGMIGGVGAVRNSDCGKMLIESAIDIATKRNRFEFAKASGICIYPKLQADWKKLGPAAFSYEVLEELIKPEDTSQRQFSQDIKLLEQIWLEKVPADKRY